MKESTYAHTFSLRRHWWFDAGLAGLYYIAVKKLKTKTLSIVLSSV